MREPLKAYYIIYCCAFLAIAALLVSVLVQIDQTYTCDGVIETEEKITLIQPINNAHIKLVHVKVGDVVAKDAVLITFDTTRHYLELQKLKKQLIHLDEKIIGLKSELSAFQNPSIMPQHAADSLYAEEWQVFTTHWYSKKQNLDHLRYKVFLAGESLSLAQQQKNDLEKLKKMYTKLYLKHYVSTVQMLQLQEKIRATEMNYLTLNLDYAQFRSELTTATTELENDRKKVHINLQKNLNELDLTRINLVHAIAAETEKLQWQTLRAPCKAIVLAVSPISANGTAISGQPLILLAPSTAALHVTLLIDSKAIGWLSPATTVTLALESLSTTRYGYLHGKIQRLIPVPYQSAMNFQDDNAKNLYQAKVILLEKDLKHLPKNFKLAPGMHVRAYVKVGRRRLLSVLLEPFSLILKES